MNQLPGLCVCVLAALLYLAGGRPPQAAAPGADERSPLRAEAPLPGLAPAALVYRRSRAGVATDVRLRIERTDRRVRVEDGVTTWLLDAASLAVGRCARDGSLAPVAVDALARAGWPSPSALALAGITSDELFATRGTGRVEVAFGLAFEERLSIAAGGPSVWWSAELGAPLRVERRATRLELVGVADAPPGELLVRAARSSSHTPGVAGL